MVPRARRSPGLASYPPSPPRSALTGASSGSRSWSSSARDGAAGSLFRKRVAVSAGGRSLYEIGRDSGGAAFFGTPPPVPLLGQREGDPAGVGLCVRRRGFFVPLFQGGVLDDEPAVLRNAGRPSSTPYASTKDTGADRCLTFRAHLRPFSSMPGVAKVQERSGIRQLTLPAQPRDPMRGDIVEEVLRAMLFRSTSARQRIRHGIRHTAARV